MAMPTRTLLLVLLSLLPAPIALTAEPPSLLERLHEPAPIVCAHRGRLDESRPENSLLEMQKTFDAGIRMMEVDLAESSDHVVFLLHDDTLDRTTDSTGAPASHTAAELRRVHLRKPDGTVTSELFPEFEALLTWAQRTGAYLMLDIKHTPPQTAATLVARHYMERQVLLLTFDDATTAAAFSADPSLPVSVLVKTPAQVDAHRTARTLFYVPAAAASSVDRYAACAAPVITDSMGPLDDSAAAQKGLPFTGLFTDRPVRILVTNHPVLAQSHIPPSTVPVACSAR